MNNQPNLKLLALTAAIAIASLTTVALADERKHDKGRDRGWHDEGWRRDDYVGGVVVAPPGYYVRPPVIYAAPPPPPVYYTAPQPVYSAPPFIAAQPVPSLSIGVTVPLH